MQKPCRDYFEKLGLVAGTVWWRCPRGLARGPGRRAGCGSSVRQAVLCCAVSAPPARPSRGGAEPPRLPVACLRVFWQVKPCFLAPSSTAELLEELRVIFEATSSCWLVWGKAGMVLVLHKHRGRMQPCSFWVHLEVFAPSPLRTQGPSESSAICRALGW